MRERELVYRNESFDRCPNFWLSTAQTLFEPFDETDVVSVLIWSTKTGGTPRSESHFDEQPSFVNLCRRHVDLELPGFSMHLQTRGVTRSFFHVQSIIHFFPGGPLLII